MNKQVIRSKQELHIAVIRRKYTTSGGGAEKYTRRLVKGLLDRGHEITVLAEQFMAQETSRLHYLPIPGTLFAASKTSGFHQKVQRIIAQHQFDVVYGLCRTFPTDLLRVTEQLHVEWHAMGYPNWTKYLPRHRSILNLENKIFNPNNTKCVVTNSQLVKAQIIEHYSYPEERIQIVYNGIDHKRFFPATKAERAALRSKFKFSESDKIILFVAENFKIKGLSSAIRAVAKADNRQPDTKLVIIGGDDREPYLALANSLGIADRVIFRGRQNNLRDYYVMADMLLYPSLYEPFGNVCLEAFSCGIPVITTRRNGSSEIIDHGCNGFIVDTQHNIAEMADYIGKLCSLNRDERQAFYDSALSKSKQFNWTTHIDQIEALLKMLKQGHIPGTC